MRLKAGEWRSGAFHSYMELHALEKEAVAQVHEEESEDELDSCVPLLPSSNKIVIPECPREGHIACGDTEALSD